MIKSNLAILRLLQVANITSFAVFDYCIQSLLKVSKMNLKLKKDKDARYKEQL